MATKVPVVDPNDLGRGIKRNEAKKKFEVDLTEYVDGTSVTYAEGKLSASGSSGLDCSAIGSLPKEAMTKTTTVLGRNDKGQCVQVAVLDSIFQDVGVGISANTYSGFVGDKYNVKVTVTNTGEGTNENTTLSIIKPALGSYKISNQTHTSQGAGGVTKISDTEYKITKLAKGGTVVVSFDVVGTSHGTYQFSATVDPQSAVDTNATNHRATISLNVNTKADESYQATNDCPAVVVTDIATGTVLKNTSSTVGLDANTLNIYETPLENRTLRLDGASTVVVSYSNGGYVGGNWFCTVGGNGTVTRAVSGRGLISLTPTSQSPFLSNYANVGFYTFDSNTQLLSLTVGAGAKCVVAMRPAGANCRWQYFAVGVLAPIKPDGCTIESSPPPTERRISLKADGYDFDLASASEGTTVDTKARIYKGTTRGSGSSNVTNLPLSTRSEVTFVCKKGTAKTINVTTDTCDDVSKLISNGKVKFTPTGKNSLTITIVADAKPTDSIKLGSITVKIVD